MTRFKQMRQLHPEFSNFCFGIVFAIILGGLFVCGIHFGWIYHLEFGYTIGNSNNHHDSIVALARLSVIWGVLAVFFAFMALVEFLSMLQKTKSQ